MITIEQYITHIDKLKEAGLLSDDFRIIQYTDGSLLGVNGKCLAFEERPVNVADYVMWDLIGRAYDSPCKNGITVPAFEEVGSIKLTKMPLFSRAQNGLLDYIIEK